MGNFFVDGISDYGYSKCGTLLIDILNSSPNFENQSLFSNTDYRSGFTNYLEDTNNIFAHPFLNNSNNIDFDSALAFAGSTSGGSSSSSMLDPIMSLLGLDDLITGNVLSAVPQMLQNVSPKLAEAAQQAGRAVESAYTEVRTFVGNLCSNLISYAKSFVGKVNCDREGNRIFSGGKNQAWCADFVTYCARKTFGGKLPSDFGASAVSGLRDWGSRHGCYFEAPFSQGLTAMRNFLKTKIRPGDIMIEKRNGKSHTGIVTYVDPNGQFFKTVEGNASNSVKERTYQADSRTLSGFVSLAQYA